MQFVDVIETEIRCFSKDTMEDLKRFASLGIEQSEEPDFVWNKATINLNFLGFFYAADTEGETIVKIFGMDYRIKMDYKDLSERYNNWKLTLGTPQIKVNVV